MNISIYDCIGKGYENGWFTNCHCRYRVFAGARNTKKSVDILGYEVIFKILSQEYRNVLIIRQNQTDNYQSTYVNIINLICSLRMERYFKWSNNPMTITYLPTGQKIIFRGFNNPTSVTSMKVQHGYLTDVYVEEASEIKSYEEFRKLDGTIRGNLPEGYFLQITFCLNPWNKDHWIYNVFFKGEMEDDLNYLENNDYQDFCDKNFSLGFGKGLYLHKSTYKINEYRASDYDENMLLLRQKAPEIYKVEGLGMWGNSTDNTYPEFSDKLVKSRIEVNNMKYSCFAIGIDTGLSDGEGKVLYNKDHPDRVKSATTMELVGISDDYQKLVAIDEYFYTNQNQMIKKTQPELLVDILNKLEEWFNFYRDKDILMKGTILVYVDCADIGFRQSLELEARKRGLINIRFIGSTKIRIQTRVDFYRTLMGWGDFIISEACSNLIREIKNSRKGDKGEPREDFDDHCINANEYGATPLLPRLRRWSNFKQH